MLDYVPAEVHGFCRETLRHDPRGRLGGLFSRILVAKIGRPHEALGGSGSSR